MQQSGGRALPHPLGPARHLPPTPTANPGFVPNPYVQPERRNAPAARALGGVSLSAARSLVRHGPRISPWWGAELQSDRDVYAFHSKEGYDKVAADMVRRPRASRAP